MGERDLALQKREGCGAEPMQVDTFGGRLHVELMRRRREKAQCDMNP